MLRDVRHYRRLLSGLCMSKACARGEALTAFSNLLMCIARLAHPMDGRTFELIGLGAPCSRGPSTSPIDLMANATPPRLSMTLVTIFDSAVRDAPLRKR